MKRPILVLLLIILSITAKAQVTPDKFDTTQRFRDHGNIDERDYSHRITDLNFIYEVEQAQFPKGSITFDDYIKNNQHLPEQYSHGRVIVQVVVELDGTLSNIKILRAPSEIYIPETLRLLKNSPAWIPAKINFQSVRSYLTFPINFGAKE